MPRTHAGAASRAAVSSDDLSSDGDDAPASLLLLGKKGSADNLRDGATRSRKKSLFAGRRDSTAASSRRASMQRTALQRKASSGPGLTLDKGAALDRSESDKMLGRITISINMGKKKSLGIADGQNWPSWRRHGWPPSARQAASEGWRLPSALVRRGPSHQTPPGGRVL